MTDYKQVPILRAMAKKALEEQRISATEFKTIQSILNEYEKRDDAEKNRIKMVAGDLMVKKSLVFQN